MNRHMKSSQAFLLRGGISCEITNHEQNYSILRQNMLIAALEV